MNKEKEQFILFRIRAFSDESALEALMNVYGEKLRRFLEMKLPNREEAQDAFSETWTRFWNYAQGTEVESCSGLLFTIARGIVAQYYRSRARSPEQLHDPEIMAEMHSIEPDTIDQIDVSLLRQFIQQLSESDAEVIFLRYIEGYKVKEIAEQFGKTENATSVMLHRAIQKLRTMIHNQFGDV